MQGNAPEAIHRKRSLFPRGCAEAQASCKHLCCHCYLAVVDFIADGCCCCCFGGGNCGELAAEERASCRGGCKQSTHGRNKLQSADDDALLCREVGREGELQRDEAGRWRSAAIAVLDDHAAQLTAKRARVADSAVCRAHAHKHAVYCGGEAPHMPRAQRRRDAHAKEGRGRIADAATDDAAAAAGVAAAAPAASPADPRGSEEAGGVGDAACA